MGPKTFILSLLCWALLQPLAWSADAKLPAEAEPEKDPIWKDPQVSAIYEKCLAKLKQGQSEYLGVQECLTKELPKDKADTINKLMTKINAKKEGVLKKPTANPFVAKEDPNTAILKAYEEKLYDMFQEAFYGIVKGKDGKPGSATRVVGHERFLEVYKTELGKEIVASVSDYCVNAGSDFKLSSDPKVNAENRLNNIAKLQKTSTDAEGNSSSEGSVFFSNCLGNLQTICSGGSGTSAEPSKDGQKKESPQKPDAPQVDVAAVAGKNEQPEVPADKAAASSPDKSSLESCRVLDKIDKFKRALLEVDKVLDKVNRKDKNGKIPREEDSYVQVTGFARHNDKNATPYELYDNSDNGKKKEKSINTMTTQTSKEFYDATKAKSEQILKELKECEKSFNANCDKFIVKLDKQNAAELLRQAQGQLISKTNLEIEEIGKMDEAKLREYLKNDGRSQAQIELAFKDFPNDLQGMIKAIQKGVRDRQYSTAARLNDAYDLSLKQPKDQITEQIKRLEDSYKGKQESLHFNNIATGYLSVEAQDEKKTKSTNSAVTFKELKSSSVSDKKGGSDTDNSVYMNKLNQAVVEKGQLKETKPDKDTKAGSTTINPESTNDALFKIKK